MGGIGSAHGKLMLFGEHAAVYGHPAVGVAMPESLSVRLHGGRVPDWDVRQIPDEDREPVRRVLARLEESVPGFSSAGRCSLLIESTVPRGTGFGSSAALCGALALAALEHSGVTLSGSSPREAWRHAHEAERLFHGTPSGVDTGLSLIGGMLAFRPQPPGLPAVEVLPAAGLCLVAGAVPRDEACGTLIAGLGARMRAGDAVVMNAMEALGGVAQKAWDALKAAEEPARTAVMVGVLANQAMESLRALGLSTPALDELIRRGREAGATGGKLSGAGGGGAFYLIATDAAAAQTIVDAIASTAARHGIALASAARAVLLPAD
jgi:mevalonate kinase